MRPKKLKQTPRMLSEQLTGGLFTPLLLQHDDDYEQTHKQRPWMLGATFKSPVWHSGPRPTDMLHTFYMLISLIYNMARSTARFAVDSP